MFFASIRPGKVDNAAGLPGRTDLVCEDAWKGMMQDVGYRGSSASKHF